MNTRQTNFWLWLAGKLPKRLVYFCFVDVMAHATTGDYSNTIVPELEGLEALKRYGDDFGI